MKKILLLLAVCGPALADDAATLHCRTLSDGVARLACYDAMPVGESKAAVAVAPLTVEQQKQAFGMEGKKNRAVDAMPAPQLASLSTHIPGAFQGWQPGQIITLANGQRWKVVDGSDGVIIGKDLKATLVRGMLGAIYLDIEGASRSPKVLRIQ